MRKGTDLIFYLLDVLLHARACDRFRGRVERPGDPATAAKLSEDQADVIVEVIE